MTDAKAETEAAFRAMKARVANLNDDAMDLSFHQGRTVYAWLDRNVPDALLRRVVDLSQLPPTSANSLPARYVVVKSKAGKERLKPCLSSGNVDKTMAAPATLIVGYDLDFSAHMDRLFPAGSMKSMFEKNPDFAAQSAFRNSTLMGAYAIMAARSLGLDCGPMSGFDPAAVDAEFFAGTRIKSNFLCNLGYGDPASVRPRGDKFAFDEIASVV